MRYFVSEQPFDAHVRHWLDLGMRMCPFWGSMTSMRLWIYQRSTWS